MAQRLYDTRSRSKRTLETLVDGEVGIYVCGITPYSPSHIGHARQAIAFDIIVRWLRKSGLKVNHITNFTDIDDKIISIANEENIDFLEVANRNIDDYFEVMDLLNVIPADAYPRVTETIPGIIDMIKNLIDKGNAYSSSDGVYFEIHTAPEKYGQLTGQTLEMVREGAGGRVSETGSGKKNHRDFALWKIAKPGEPYWPSPWGNGRPGWHIECSVMSLQHLGEKFDIHGGGSDLIFPHHEAEIFQSECCLNHDPVVQYWMHNGMINVDGEKMSKSLGNFWTIRDAISKIKPLELRYSLINAPYRQPVEFNDTILQDSSSHYHKLLSAYGEGLSKSGKSDWNDLDFLQTAELNFSNGMDDDFNTRVAIVEIQSVVKYLREKLDSGSDKEISSAVSWLSEFAGNVLGILPEDEEILANIERIEGEKMRLQDQVIDLLSQRKIARQNKDWERADLIRNQLNEIGVVVEDSPKGPVWKLK
ncbi:MAG TPA: cysteine--tRNA ligase [Candidatus Thalassarchaeaceae archaeon]|jgi:cysteinyl-tRNA synthetase|nr:cysteine--tRNA ligase [Euryarchaeota archaeon]DAC64327.1 MAG TPA: cysteine--tRNA ligase [Candidatus Poseidoniales archaeon]HII12282.1 cysteine--tRNA ligase [Candidatus Thalassarchaeaceae archaeon]MBT3847144.1 cysteine--tRNA ligase [Euryarchaeota archaeon]MBT4157068.1 cysteine--tRNA ligase [Euryarchaeota archaeon]